MVKCETTVSLAVRSRQIRSEQLSHRSATCHQSGSSYIPGQLHAREPYTPYYHESTVPQNPLAATAATARMFFLRELK